MSKAIEKIKENANKLGIIRHTIARIKEEKEKELAHWETLRDELQTSLLLQFDKEGLTSIKTDNGAGYSKATRKGIEVTNDRAAFEWAIEERAVSINKPLIKQKLEPLVAAGKPLPEGFQYKEVFYISVREPKVAATEPAKE